MSDTTPPAAPHTPAQPTLEPHIRIASDGATPRSPGPALVLYAPAIAEPAGSGAIDGAAQRIARTLDHRSEPVGVTYAVREAAPEKFGSGGVAEVREIVRVTPDQPERDGTVTHRVFHLNYPPALDEPQAPNLLVHAGRLLLLWAAMFVRFIRPVIFAEALSKRQKAAVAVAGVCLLLVTVYVMLALAALLHVVLNLIEGASGATGPGNLAGAFGDLDALLDSWFQSTWVRAAGVLGALGLTFGRFRAWLERTVNIYLRFGRYMESADARATCTGMFNELLEHLLSRNAPRVDVVAYSLGSLVALDALFPADGQPANRAARISTLTTIGCPFDLVRTFWPAHFTQREVSAPALKWFNVYSPVDLLGSNFVNADGLEDPRRGINFATPFGKDEDAETPPQAMVRPVCNLFYDPMGRQELSIVDALLGGAYRAHAQYWVPHQPAAESCYKRFIPLVYPQLATAAS